MGHSFMPREHMAQTRALGLILMLACAGCSESPSSFTSRLTENGRLLADGPPARMTARAIAETQADSVPLLYSFAIEAGQIQPVGGKTFPETDLNLQQAALSSSSINWPAVTLVGEGYVDEQCNRFLSALNDLERSKRGTLADVNAIQSATVGIMGLALAAQEAIGIVGIAFGLTASLIDNTTSVVLYQLPTSSIRAVVKAQRDVLRLDETAPDGSVTRITNQGLASARLSEYVQYCVPVTIEANISGVLGGAKIDGKDKIAASDVQPAITSSLAPVISAIRPGTPIDHINPTNPGVSQVAEGKVRARLLAVFGSIRATTDAQVLKSVAAALKIPLTATDPPTRQQNQIIREIDNRVTAGDPATAAVRMTQIEQAVQPILNPTH